MAKIKFGMMMTDARGKLGGHVFSKTRSGATVRTKVTPSNPQTVAQQTARTIFGQLSAMWRTLTEEQRLSWNSAVNNYQKTNIFGDNYLPSGKNLFVGLNSNLLNAGGSANTSAPLPLEVPAYTLSSFTLDTNDELLTLSLVGGEPGIGFMKVIEATKPFSAGRYNFTGAFAKIFSYEVGAIGTPATFYDQYCLKYGVPATGTKISVRVFVVNLDTGQSSIPSQVTAIVTNNP